MSVLRRLLFFWRSQLMVSLGVLIATAVCIGSLALGDSTQASLQRSAEERIGKIEHGIIMQGRFVHQHLAQRLTQAASIPLAPVLSLRGIISDPAQQKTHPRILVHGVDDAFWRLAPGNDIEPITGLAINQALFDYLGSAPAADVILRLEKPSLLSRDAPLTPDDEALETLRLPISRVLSNDAFGAFQLSSQADAQMNVFLPLSMLQDEVALSGWVNQFFIGRTADDSAVTSLAHVQEALAAHWQLEDVGIAIHEIDGIKELRSERIFMDRLLEEPMAKLDTSVTSTNGSRPQARGAAVLSYMVNSFEAGERKTPYSIVAALDDALLQKLPMQHDRSLADDEIIINQWLADDLQIGQGASLTLRYYSLQQNNEMLEEQREFTVAAVVPLSGLAADRHLMPAFPGLADKDDCREWDPGARVELADIRDKDERYWDDYRGTPKAFISLASGRALWSNRFGSATAYRLNAVDPDFMTNLRNELQPSDFAVHVTPVAAMLRQAAKGGATYISSVFVSLSMFLIMAALILVGLFYGISIQQRRKEMGILIALGFTPKQVQRRLLKEQLLFLVGAVMVGVLCSYMYFYVLFTALSSTWAKAIADAQLLPAMSLQSMIIGGSAVLLTALLIMWLQLRGYRRQRPTDLLSGRSAIGGNSVASARVPCFCAGLFLLGAVLSLLFLPLAANDPMKFFAASVCALIAGLCGLNGLSRFLLQRRRTLSRSRLLVLNWSYHSRRHTLLTAMLASCVFLVIASAAFQLHPQQEAVTRSGGTGGFHYFGQLSLPIEKDLHSSDGQDLYAIDAADMDGLHMLLMRGNNDEETSCINLNQAQEPRLWGLDWRYLAEQQAFTFMQAAAYKDSPWELLGEKRGQRIPVIGDINSLLWSLGKGLGSVFIYKNEAGVRYELEVVGLIQDSMLQGGLLMDEQYFNEMFPHKHGYNYCLLEVDRPDPASAADFLEQRFRQHGLVLEPSRQRLQRYVDVRNTYILIFQAIGALGVALGSIGIAALVLRHVFERRSEFAIMRSYGYRMNSLWRLVFWEHAMIVLAALCLGILAASVAMYPIAQDVLQLVAAWVPMLLIVIVALSATAVACRIAMRGEILEALRSE